MTTSHASHPDRLLPADPGTRDIARRLLAHVEDLPIISPHGHLEASMFVKDEAFPDPTSLLISPDHYLTRMMHSAGVDLADLRVGGHEGKSAREAWRIFMSHWDLYAGTATGYWVEQEFEHVFGINAERLNVGTPEHADAIFDELTDILAQPDFRPRALAEQFNLEVLATTDDPLDDLADHKALADDPTFSPRVLPTFRPDAYTKMYNAGWAEKTTKLIDTAGDGKAGWEGYLQAMRNRRQYFINHGATSADHGLHDTDTTPLSHEDAQKILDKGLAGTATLAEMRAFEANTTYRFAEMSQEDGLVMTIHPGVYRNHSASAQKKFGADIGADIPFQMEFTNGLRPLLSDFGENKDFHFVMFTIDESVYSREVAPLAGYYPAAYVGAPWWFIDEIDAMNRFRSATTGTTGFSRYSGFIDDTRAYCSIPARHNTSRRVEANYLARLVAEHRITESCAAEIIVDLIDASPRRVFKL
ncbi:glucuronate isomerase [Corynebacterium glutamicum MT]|uniref:Uronate isomerase n=1 Tax=Corynebacterium glutamicum TaxID=1718 RepID=A0AB36I6B1_CORGT|nr:glucuronate isomerase [Corynebacterium glutamicum]AGN20011.1 glucuronate isomerase [Corynebacterium glutamicum SCgG1]AGN23035.1 glucuronate isomerase [Corynebacterium glutamicum SCgG2]EOA63522.1 glucuronate isomerase [Corynebacterium glutamicum MT]EPP40113.1 glucuronate isomerase [Corynebacterium glutamicum Z188]NII86476.1 glucuronate isomerase [Corynebacterium glutamicum]